MERVSARDGDTGVNDDVFFTLEDAGNYLINGQLSFIIDAETGEISVNVTSLDRETHSSYALTVTVGGPSLSPDCVHLITLPVPLLHRLRRSMTPVKSPRQLCSSLSLTTMIIYQHLTRLTTRSMCLSLKTLSRAELCCKLQPLTETLYMRARPQLTVHMTHTLALAGT